MSLNETATRLMDVAEVMVKERGFNAFSYKDLSDAVGIRKASIHYHFPAKNDLGAALMERFLRGLEESLAGIDAASRTNRARLKAFIKLYAGTESSGHICMCGSLASDRETLPPALQDAVSAYMERSERWVAEKVRDGIQDGEFQALAKPADLAVSLVAGLQGGLITARGQGGRATIEIIQRVFFKALEAR